ncbi:MAG: hypothetical protein HYV63_07580 [Candidatus Schekmanbacteria bacterium]|nr:hypothetical protein [Candidatus Schekmanbacteria bacterium]
MVRTAAVSLASHLTWKPRERNVRAIAYIALSAAAVFFPLATARSESAGASYHAQVALDAMTAAPPQLRAPWATFLDETQQAAMEIHAIRGPDHPVSELLDEEIDRAARLLKAGGNAFKGFKAMMRVAHLAADLNTPCVHDPVFMAELDRRIREAVTTGLGFAVGVAPPERDSRPPAPAPGESACTVAAAQGRYAGVISGVWNAWDTILERAGLELRTTPVAIRRWPEPEKSLGAVSDELVERRTELVGDVAVKISTTVDTSVRLEPRPDESAGSAYGKLDDQGRDEAWWQEQLAYLRRGIDRAYRHYQWAISHYTEFKGTAAEDAARAVMEEAAREYASEKAKIPALQEACRRAGCLPGWVR